MWNLESGGFGGGGKETVLNNKKEETTDVCNVTTLLYLKSLDHNHEFTNWTNCDVLIPKVNDPTEN